MRWLEIFKIYNLKLLKKEKVLFLFTTLSILITITISLVIPQINLENSKYLDNNIRKINGGDLSIVLRIDQTKEFQDKIEELKTNGLDVKTSKLSTCYYKKQSNKIIGTMVSGDYSLEKDEIILQSTLANNLGVKKGDFVELDTMGNGILKYKVKDIEPMAMGVDHDGELLGYGKIQQRDDLNIGDARTMIYISGQDGEKLKEELIKYEDSNMYISIKDKTREMESQMAIQSAVLGTLSTVGYIVSALAIISTTIMLILKRKRDIAILRMVSVDIKNIKRALRLELSLWLAAPILVGGLISYKISTFILSYVGIETGNMTMENISLILKGVIFNSIIFFMLINIALMIIKSIKPLSVIREDEKLVKKSTKKVILITSLCLPLFLGVYGIYSGSIATLGSTLVIILVIMLFLGIVALVVKLLSLIHFRNTVLIYSIKSIKNNFFSFILVLLSLTLTLWFILIGFNLQRSITENINNSLSKILPYNYVAESKDNENLEKVLKSENDVTAYSKIFSIAGKVQNDFKNSMFKAVSVGEVNKNDYNVKFKIVEGDDLFQGENGVVISNERKERNNLQIGDILSVETKKGTFNYKIKGVYDSGGIGSVSILKENVEIGEGIEYMINSKSDKFIDKLKDSAVVNMSCIGESLSSMLGKFLKIFRILSIICVLSTVLFNINMLYMNYSQGEKDDEVIRALGLGNRFLLKSQGVKIFLFIILSSALSLGVYYLSIQLFIKAMFKTNVEVGLMTVGITLINALVLSLIAFNLPIRKMLSKKELNLLRD
ncbi:ABC transporter permease [Clostridium frigidicarnis]|uniref:Putative ABC transport system permease protein n=1 Tax=Clostridium frigidicarnis TaxID=84698 RepID=A0A1I1AQY8_9CLOT|nr:FtsX-like permease family protein [Clostridium frigidicarnis]SFB40451.1 putative ABC transport system permease protein [Clostridium frigidicarnis]